MRLSGGSDWSAPVRAGLPSRWVADECHISDKFTCITTQSRAGKARVGRSTAGGWGTTRSPKMGPRLGRYPRVLRIRERFCVGRHRSQRSKNLAYGTRHARSSAILTSLSVAGTVRAPRGPGSPARRSGAPSARHPGPTARRAAAVSSAAHPTGPRIASRNMIARRRYLTADDRPCYPGQYPLLRLVATTPTDRTAQAVISWSHPSSAAGMCRWPSASTRNSAIVSPHYPPVADRPRSPCHEPRPRPPKQQPTRRSSPTNGSVSPGCGPGSRRSAPTPAPPLPGG
jgi:hypothetical protein